MTTNQPAPSRDSPRPQGAVRIGLVGLGRFGTGFHLRRLLDMGDGVVVAGLCDRSPERLAARDPRLADCFTCTDMEALIDPARVDGIIVSTTNPDHFAPCRLALERGVPAMVDKPTTVTAAEAEALVELSRQRDVPFLTAFTRRFFPAVERVRERIRTGAAGEVAVVGAVQLGCPPNDRPQDGGFLHQRNVHIFDLVTWLTGSPVHSVRAEVRYDGPWETFADMRLQLASGTQVHFLSLSDTAQNQDEVSVYGSQAIYRIQRERLFVNRQRGEWLPEPDLPSARHSATSYFVDVVAGAVPAGEQVLHRHSEDGWQAMRILEAVVASGRTGQTVELSP